MWSIMTLPMMLSIWLRGSYPQPSPWAPAAPGAAGPGGTGRGRGGARGTRTYQGTPTAKPAVIARATARAEALSDWLRHHDPHAWLVTAALTLLAAATRLPLLGRIRRLVFDETYYVKDAFSLNANGYESKWEVPSTWPSPAEGEDAARDAINQAFAQGDFSALVSDPAYVVHPQTGKWLIALGMDVFGNGPFGWRIAAAVAGIISVTLMCRLAWHLFHRHSAVAVAGLVLALDGVSIALSRIGLLDVFLTVFVVAAILCVVLDRRSYRPKWLRLLDSFDPSSNGLGPNAGYRPWLLAAGVMCGLATSVKWSGLYVLATIGIFVVLDDIVVRRGRVKHWLLSGIVVEGIPAFFYLVPTAALVYAVSWWSWFTHPGSWGRKSGTGFVATINDWLAYHQQVLSFHSSLSSPHSYMSSAPQWLIQWRPTSVAFESQATGCRSGDCVRAILALGNPALWWLAALGIVFAAAVLARRALVPGEGYPLAVVALGYAGTYLPWFLYLHRTTFNFYTVVLAPFVALLFTWCTMVAWRLAGEVGSPGLRLAVRLVVVATILLVVACFVFFFPIWSGMLIDRTHWSWRMWLPSWV
ncbi:MAG: phospholipid carrier-dependent glycosyltransferase [Actinomycetaceae bacterium]|nr:phospholipid carrier-dependent glycosyltransferase [Actinomycetaceae bacterium]